MLGKGYSLSLRKLACLQGATKPKPQATKIILRFENSALSDFEHLRPTVKSFEEAGVGACHEKLCAEGEEFFYEGGAAVYI